MQNDQIPKVNKPSDQSKVKKPIAMPLIAGIVVAVALLSFTAYFAFTRPSTEITQEDSTITKVSARIVGPNVSIEIDSSNGEYYFKYGTSAVSDTNPIIIGSSDLGINFQNNTDVKQGVLVPNIRSTGGNIIIPAKVGSTTPEDSVDISEIKLAHPECTAINPPTYPGTCQFEFLGSVYQEGFTGLKGIFRIAQ